MQYTKQGETIKYPKKKRQERRKDRGKQQYQANLGGNRGKETRKPGNRKKSLEFVNSFSFTKNLKPPIASKV